MTLPGAASGGPGSRSRWPVSWALGSAVAIWAIYDGGAPRFVTLNLTTSFFYGWLVILAASGLPGWVGKAASFGPLRYIGRISYGDLM